MTSNSSNRIYIGTINPGGSISQSGGNARVRPFTTPAAPGRSSFGSSNNALTVLSSHPTSLRNAASPQDDDLVMIEDEVSSASSSRSQSSRSTSRRASSRSESVSSVSVDTPLRQAPPRSFKTSPPFQEKTQPTEAFVSPQPTVASSASCSSSLQLAQASASSAIATATRRVRPVIEASKAKPESSVPKVLAGRDRAEAPRRIKRPSPTTAQPSAPSKLVSSTSSDTRKRPETAGATSKPKCVSLGRKELIGKGSFGMVYKALDLDTNRLLAVKEIPLDGPNLQQLPTVRREILLMEKLSHPNIVQCLGHDLDDQYLRIYMEFVAGGCVSSLLKNFGRFQERQAAIVTKQVLSGLQYLHDRKIAHRDLKGDNILLQPDGTVKLADFGTARELATTAMSLAGTAYFMAPEMIKGTGHGLEADIWSVGCCIIEMLTGKPPFSHLVNQYAIMTHIAESNGPFDDAFPPNCSPQVTNILKRCLVRDPSKRATCEQLLREDWVVNPPANADMKGPLILEKLPTVSDARERSRKGKGAASGYPTTGTGKSTLASEGSPKSVAGTVTGPLPREQPLSSFNPMIDDDE